MVSCTELRIGMQVKVRDDADVTTPMRKWLGKTVTITDVYGAEDIRIIEDFGEYSWYESDFEYIIDEVEIDPTEVFEFCSAYGA